MNRDVSIDNGVTIDKRVNCCNRCQQETIGIQFVELRTSLPWTVHSPVPTIRYFCTVLSDHQNSALHHSRRRLYGWGGIGR